MAEAFSPMKALEEKNQEIQRLKESLEERTKDRDEYVQLYSRLDAAVHRHRQKPAVVVTETDQSLWRAQDQILKQRLKRESS